MQKTKNLFKWIIIFAILIFSQNSFASPQVPDYIIYKGDTIPIYNLILEKYFQKIEKSDKGSLFGLKFREGATLNCWRGYQAIYLIENDSLFLKNIIDCGERKIDQLASSKRILEIFGHNENNEKVFIDWFSGYFNIPNGDLLRWDGVFHKSFENEILVKVQKGKVCKISEIQNYVDDPKRINRKYGDTISKVIFNELSKLNWKNKNDFDCSEKYLVTIGKNGEVTKVIMPEYRTKEEIKRFWEPKEYKHCIKTVQKGLKDLKFDILKVNRKAIEERYYVDIWIEDDGTLEDWTE
ncbi:hypothetical protein [Winogradskyella helgolandensis]|uniref:hypothetical protein n=1 Tax=Winogradskyella helgolandensis TaxID=2697010 RepID=UPI0015C86827|nr:hypothetical protein [Winogradskyella helgolandensis]